jgi:hypothetical protein
MMRENRLSLGDIARLTFAWMARPLHPYFDRDRSGRRHSLQSVNAFSHSSPHSVHGQEIVKSSIRSLV